MDQPQPLSYEQRKAKFQESREIYLTLHNKLNTENLSSEELKSILKDLLGSILTLITVNEDINEELFELHQLKTQVEPEWTPDLKEQFMKEFDDWQEELRRKKG